MTKNANFRFIAIACFWLFHGIPNVHSADYNPEKDFDNWQGGYSQGMAWVVKNNKYGYIDQTSGILVIGLQYLAATSFSGNGLARVTINTIEKTIGNPEGLSIPKSGFIDTRGRWIIGPFFDELGNNFTNGRIQAKYRGKYGILNERGIWIIGPYFDSIGTFNNGTATATVGSKTGLIDQNGHWIVRPVYDSIDSFNNGVARASYKEKIGYINTTGKWLLDPVYDQMQDPWPNVNSYSIGIPCTTENNSPRIMVQRNSLTQAQLSFLTNNVWIEDEVIVQGSTIDGRTWHSATPPQDGRRKGLLVTSVTADNDANTTTITLSSALDSLSNASFVKITNNNFPNFTRISINGKIGFLDLSGKRVAYPDYFAVDQFSTNYFHPNYAKATVKFIEKTPTHPAGLSFTRTGYIDVHGKWAVGANFDDIVDDWPNANVYGNAVPCATIAGSTQVTLNRNIIPLTQIDYDPRAPRPAELRIGAEVILTGTDDWIAYEKKKHFIGAGILSTNTAGSLTTLTLNKPALVSNANARIRPVTNNNYPNYSRVNIKQKFGFINQKGEMVIGPYYTEAAQFRQVVINGITNYAATVRVDGIEMDIDTTGKPFLPDRAPAP